MKKLIMMLAVLSLLTVNNLYAEDAPAAAPAAAEDVYTVDPAHTTLGFKIKHLGISTVTGKFDKFEGTVTLSGDTVTAVEGTADVKSINTADKGRDEHLLKEDFFAADKFPSMKFKSTKVTQDGSKLGVVGELTIRDVTKVVVLSGEWGGKAFLAYGGGVHKTGLVLEGQIKRTDFGMKASDLMETGKAMIGEEVNLTLDIEADKKEPKKEEAAK